MNNPNVGDMLAEKIKLQLLKGVETEVKRANTKKVMTTKKVIKPFTPPIIEKQKLRGNQYNKK